jgi:hypothetical protein
MSRTVSASVFGVVDGVNLDVDVLKTGSGAAETSGSGLNFFLGMHMFTRVFSAFWVFGLLWLFWHWVDWADWHWSWAVSSGFSFSWSVLGVVDSVYVYADILKTGSGAAEAGVLFWGFLAHWGWSVSWSVSASVVRVVLGVNLDVDVLKAGSGAAKTGSCGLNFFLGMHMFTRVFFAFWVYWMLWLFRVDGADWHRGWAVSSRLSFSWSVLRVVNSIHANVDGVERSGAAHTASWLFRCCATARSTATLGVVDGVDFDVDIVKSGCCSTSEACVLFWHFLAYWSGSVAVSASVLGVVLGVNLDVDVFEGDMRRLTAFTLGVVFRVDVDVDVLKAISSIVRSCKGTGAEERNEQKNESSHCRGVSVESA